MTTNTKKIATKAVTKVSKIDTSKGSKKSGTETVPVKAKSEILYKRTDIKLIDTATADKNIKDIRSTGTKLRKLAHTTACGILLHWQQHGDMTKLTSLAEAIGATMSKQMQRGFYEWIKCFTSLVWNEKTGKWDCVAKDRAKLFNLEGNPEADKDTFAFRGALNEPFYSGSFGDKRLPSFDFDAALLQLLERAEKHMKLKAETKDKAALKALKIDDGQVKRLEVFAASMGVKLDKKAA